jgi:hypothetical protein
MANKIINAENLGNTDGIDIRESMTKLASQLREAGVDAVAVIDRVEYWVDDEDEDAALEIESRINQVFLEWDWVVEQVEQVDE